MPLWLYAIRRAFCNVAVHLHGTNFLQYSRRVFLWCDNVYLWKFNCTWATLLLYVRISFWIQIGSYIPPYDVDFSAKERVSLLSGHPNGDIQLLNLGCVSFAHIKATRNQCLNPKIKITFLLKYPVCAINRATFFSFEWFEILESYARKRLTQWLPKWG